MFLVTGGHGMVGSTWLGSTVSTEVMSASESTWSYVGNLPRKAFGMSEISVNNQIFVIGTCMLVKIILHCNIKGDRANFFFQNMKFSKCCIFRVFNLC